MFSIPEYSETEKSLICNSYTIVSNKEFNFGNSLDLFSTLTLDKSITTDLKWFGKDE